MHKQKQYESHYGDVDCFKLKQFSLNSTLQLATKTKPDFHSFTTYSWKKLIYSTYNFILQKYCPSVKLMNSTSKSRGYTAIGHEWVNKQTFSGSDAKATKSQYISMDSHAYHLNLFTTIQSIYMRPAIARWPVCFNIEFLSV
jgi:hypothetical protein